ncbi:unnamed protein product [Closterium sp. NIES-53]
MAPAWGSIGPWLSHSPTYALFFFPFTYFPPSLFPHPRLHLSQDLSWLDQRLLLSVPFSSLLSLTFKFTPSSCIPILPSFPLSGPSLARSVITALVMQSVL